VLAQEPRTGTPKQPSEHERDQDGVVELPEDRDEVRDEVEGKREVDERERRDELPPPRDTRVGEEPLEEDGAVGDEPREHANVPPAGADGEGKNQRHVGADENYRDEDEPLHGGGAS
jgi:hypothetical protein